MNEEKFSARTQHGHLKGTAMADMHAGPDPCMLKRYLQDKGVDLSGLEPVGLKVTQFEQSSGFAILCASDDVFEGEKLRIVSIPIDEGQAFEELKKILCRLDIVLLSPSIQPEDYDWSKVEEPVSIEDLQN